MKKPNYLMIAVFLGLSFILSACVQGPRVVESPGVSLSGEMIFVSYSNFVYALDADNRSELWRYPAERDSDVVFLAQPLVTDEFVYVGDLANNFYKINKTTGKLVWSVTAGNGYFIGQAAEAEDVVYVPSNDGNLYALDADGNLLWSFKTGHYIWAQPLILDGVIYIGSMDHSVYAVSKEGAEIWSTQLDGAVVGSSVMSEDGQTLFVGSLGKQLAALDTADGKILWSFTADESVWGEPILVDGFLYFIDSRGNFYKLDPANNGELIWNESNTGSVVGGLTALEDGFVFATEDGNIRAYDFDGTFKWSETIDGGEIIQAPVVSDDLVVVGALNGENLIYVYDLAGNEVWSYTPEN